MQGREAARWFLSNKPQSGEIEAVAGISNAADPRTALEEAISVPIEFGFLPKSRYVSLCILGEGEYPSAPEYIRAFVEEVRKLSFKERGIGPA